MRKVFARQIDRGEFPGGRERLLVHFALDGEPVEFEWTPEWMAQGRGVCDLIREAVRVERANRPGSDYLREFARVARDIVIEHAPPDSVRLERGVFQSYEANPPRVTVKPDDTPGYPRPWIRSPETWDLAVPITQEFLKRAPAGVQLWFVLWNDQVIDIRASDGRRSLID